MAECTRCGRKLKTQKSIDQEFGPVCHKKHLKELADEEFEEIQTNIYDFLGDDQRADDGEAI